MSEQLAIGIIAMIFVLSAFGFLCGVAVGRSTLGEIQSKLRVAEAALAQKQGQLNQANKLYNQLLDDLPRDYGIR